MKVLKWVGIAVVAFFVLGIIGAMFGGNQPISTSESNSSSPGFVIKVTGTDGTKFSGSYMLVTLDGKTASKSVEGTAPIDYKVDANMVSVAFQKAGEKGNLKVEILKDDQVVAESETDAAYGMVSVSTQ